MISSHSKIISSVALILALAGCGYTTRSLVSEKFQTVNIAPFINKVDITRESDAATKYKVYRPMLETEITKAVTDRFLYDGNLKPMDAEGSDLVLKGELTEFRKDPLRYTDSDEVREYRINIVVNLTLHDPKNGTTVFEEKGFTGDSTYYVSGPQAKSEDEAVSEAITDLSRRIVERVVEQW